MRLVDDIIERALAEDIGTGDLTTLCCIPAESTTEGFIYAKEKGIVAGIPVAARVFSTLSPEITFTAERNDGQQVAPGDIIASVSGPARPILTGERVALNLLQRMSGIATRTALISKILKGCRTEVVDTRKTTPGLRILDKYSVRAGGGKNHRFGLYDGILIKDNHIKVAGGIRQAIELARGNAPHTIKVEVEAENLEGVAEAVAAGADIIMLDNMDRDLVKSAVELIGGRAIVEVSGGVTEETIAEYAIPGVDFISVGALTHSVEALDISLDLVTIKTPAKS